MKLSVCVLAALICSAACMNDDVNEPNSKPLKAQRGLLSRINSWRKSLLDSKPTEGYAQPSYYDPSFEYGLHRATKSAEHERPAMNEQLLSEDKYRRRSTGSHHDDSKPSGHFPLVYGFGSDLINYPSATNTQGQDNSVHHKDKRDGN